MKLWFVEEDRSWGWNRAIVRASTAEEALALVGAPLEEKAVVAIKEIKLRSTADDHDLAFKTKAARQFLESGHKVKLTVRFRDREIVRPEKAQELLDFIIPQLEDIANVATRATMEARAMSVLIAPKPAITPNIAPLCRRHEVIELTTEGAPAILWSEEDSPDTGPEG